MADGILTDGVCFFPVAVSLAIPLADGNSVVQFDFACF